MSYLKSSINLMKLKNTGITVLDSKSGVSKKCLIIPIKDNRLFVTDKGVYLNLIAFESDKLEGASHLIKQSFSKEELDKMSEEEKNNMPILGSIYKPADPKGESYSVPQNTEAPVVSAPKDDLPF